MGLSKFVGSSRVIDATGNSRYENHLRFELSDQERMMMRKHGWDIEDIMVLRKLREVGNNLSRLPDKDYPRGWEVELDPETREPRR